MPWIFVHNTTATKFSGSVSLCTIKGTILGPSVTSASNSLPSAWLAGFGGLSLNQIFFQVSNFSFKSLTRVRDLALIFSYRSLADTTAELLGAGTGAYGSMLAVFTYSSVLNVFLCRWGTGGSLKWSVTKGYIKCVRDSSSSVVTNTCISRHVQPVNVKTYQGGCELVLGWSG